MLCWSFVLQRIPERIIEKSVRGMLPKGRLGRHIRTHLKVYKGPSHPHVAQQPTDVTGEIDLKPKETAGAALLASLRK
jgi:large subunit ribosomal protein L13